MAQSFRGGNSRQLAKNLDQLVNPTALLDRRGLIVYANSALCSLAQADATQLVGKQCSWQIPADDTPFAAILTALAPPAGALQGRILTRQLTTPVVFGSTATGQLFVPLIDEDQLVHLTLVQFGKWDEIQTQLPAEKGLDAHRRRRADKTLVTIRSRWKNLDGLLPLIGDSPAIHLAMSRAQLAITSNGHVLVTGPPGVGKSQVLEGIFLGRLKRDGLPRIAGQYLPVDCAVLDAELMGGMLDVFAGRLRPSAPLSSQQLVLQHFDQLSESAAGHLVTWLEVHLGSCQLSATSSVPTDELRKRGPVWERIISKLATVEIHIPPLAERREDIAPLAVQALANYCRKTDRAQLTFSVDTIDLLTAYPWPGNVSQLTQSMQEAINHAVLSAAVHPHHLPVPVRTYPSSVTQHAGADIEPIKLDAVLLELEKILLQRALKLSPRNRARAARLLGISRPRLLRRIAQLNLDDRPSSDDDVSETDLGTS